MDNAVECFDSNTDNESVDTMSKIEDKARAIQDVADNLLQWVRNNVEEHEEYFCDSAKSMLYDYGLDGKGNNLGEYAPRTIERKIATGLPYDRVTLRQTGDFYDGMQLVADADGFEVDSEDWKTNKLIDKYGEDITTINEYDIDMYVREELLPFLQDEIKYRL
jgi:hypothetical protein